MIWVAALVGAVALSVGGFGFGIKYEKGVQARALVAAADVRAAEAKREIKVIDKASLAQVKQVASLNQQLGDAREKIANLSGRQCLDAGTVSVLNNIGNADNLPAAPSQPASAPAAAAPAAGQRWATDADTARAIAICRARYAEVSSQLDKILDIEDARRPP